MANEGLSGTERMVIPRVLSAPRAVVWKVWTDPTYAMRWWGPKDFSTPVYRMDFRVGGRLLICMRAPDGRDLWNGGEYREIVPEEKIVYSMYFADAEGKKVEPAAYGIEHTAIDDAYDVVTFEDLGNGQTKLTLIGNESMEAAQESGQVDGWHQILDKFAAVVAELVSK